jgi:hypothetical protein
MQILRLDSRTLRPFVAVAALVVVAGEAGSFDGRKARTRFEKAIRGDRSARAADEATGGTFSALTMSADAK